MAHTQAKRKSQVLEQEQSSLATTRSTTSTSPDATYFYEIEPAVVIDVIRDENHPIFQLTDEKRENPAAPKVEPTEWPAGYNNPKVLDYSWIGRIKARMIHSQQHQTRHTLDWITPQEAGMMEYPLLNEVVLVAWYCDRQYYTRRLNARNFVNNSADYRTEHRYGMVGGITEEDCPGSLQSARNQSDLCAASNSYGKYLGKYFKANNAIRPLKHFEGDTILQSRFGSSIRFGCYEDNPPIDYGTANGYGESYDDNYGNPQILIRNRQKKTKLDEKKYQYNILENINEDGSSIHITSGRTVSKFVSTLTHTYDHVPYRRRGCVFKTFSGFDKISNSQIGRRTDIIDRELRE